MERMRFTGLGSEDVTEFLSDVQWVAFKEGHPRDDDWRVDYVAACLSGAALRWYSELEGEDQYSWMRLRQALLQHFDRTSAPSPAAAAAPGYIGALARKGRVRLLQNDAFLGYTPQSIPESYLYPRFSKDTSKALIVEAPLENSPTEKMRIINSISSKLYLGFRKTSYPQWYITSYPADSPHKGENGDAPTVWHLTKDGELCASERIHNDRLDRLTLLYMEGSGDTGQLWFERSPRTDAKVVKMIFEPV